MTKKVYLITGASSGFGLVTAKKLIAHGHTVYGAARRVERMAELKDLGGHVVSLDVTDNENVKSVVAQIIATEGRIDGLCNNAGYGSYGSIENISMDEIKYQYEVNIFGVARMIKAVLPHMRKNKSGRVVNIASLVSHVSLPMIGWYASTKHALKAMSDSLRMEVKHIGIEVVLVDPGVVNTGFNDVALEKMDQVDHAEDYSHIVSSFRKGTVERYDAAPGPEGTADSMVEALEVENPKLRYRTTIDSQIFPRLHNLVGNRIFDKLVMSQIKK